jgi:DNA repair exonuclease SbcCD ATPase subunit
MSKTPRTDEHILHHGNGNWYPSAFVLASFARQLETELADARAEIERLALEIENKQYTITCASEENQQLKESLAEARAEIERLNKKLRLLLCEEHFEKCERGLFNSENPDDEPCLICLMNATERGEVMITIPDAMHRPAEAERENLVFFTLALNELKKQLAHARAEIEEHHELVRMCHNRTMEADKLWQKAHNKPDVWPDLGVLIEWLMNLIKTPANCAEELGCERKIYYGCSGCQVFKPREIKK